jgi:uncharacterized protein
LGDRFGQRKRSFSVQRGCAERIVYETTQIAERNLLLFTLNVTCLCLRAELVSFGSLVLRSTILSLVRAVAVLIVAVLLTSCAAINLPPVTERPTNLALPGKIVWHDLITDTPEASQRFYAELFGWQYEEVGARYGLGDNINYTLIRNKGRIIGGMINENKLQRNEELSQWIVLMSVGDIEAAVAKVEAAGGLIYTPPTDFADRGWISVVADPQGAILALLQSNSGDPMDRKPRIGDFLWNEVWVNDVDAATNFYGHLAGYDSETQVLDDDLNYLILGSKTKPRIGLVRNPIPDIDPVWVTYIRVADPAAIVSRVEELGGRILVGVRDREVGGQVALIADPSGAAFAIQTWDPDKALAIDEIITTTQEAEE